MNCLLQRVSYPALNCIESNFHEISLEKNFVRAFINGSPLIKHKCIQSELYRARLNNQNSQDSFNNANVIRHNSHSADAVEAGSVFRQRQLH